MARMVVIYRTPRDPAAGRRVLAPEDDDVQMYLFDAVEV